MLSKAFRFCWTAKCSISASCKWVSMSKKLGMFEVMSNVAVRDHVQARRVMCSRGGTYLGGVGRAGQEAIPVQFLRRGRLEHGSRMSSRLLNHKTRAAERAVVGGQKQTQLMEPGGVSRRGSHDRVSSWQC